jgi:site-specific DNA-methyltransferase (adenine-specific)
LVYDPFGGSGTTAKQSHVLERNWILSELSAEYCDIAERRLKPYLSQFFLSF